MEKSISILLAGIAGLSVAAQAANYTVPSSAASLTTISQDGKCNLTEAVTSMLQGPPNSDCVGSGTGRIITLSGANTSYQLATGIQIWADMEIKTSDAGVVIEAAGQVINTSDGCLLKITGPASGMTVRVKSGSSARAVFMQGGITATNITFQGADISGKSGDDALGGVILNWGQLTMTGGAIQNGKAAHGGGLFNRTPWVTLTNVKIQNNTATGSGGGLYLEDPADVLECNRCQILNNTATARGGGAYNNGWLKLNYSAVKGNKAGQGGGLYHQKPLNGKQPELTLVGTTLSDNKAISAEQTPVPGPNGTSITATIQSGSAIIAGTNCSGSETPNEAFDGSYATKWCNTGTVPSANAKVVLTYLYPGGTTQAISAYSITWANDASGRDPKSWTFEGYNGSSWVVLHTVTDFYWSGGNRYATESFNAEAYDPFRFANTTAYRGYRIAISLNKGGLNATQIAEVQLFPQWRTGDGGGIFTIGHMNLTNSTLSGNIAGCTDAATCGCASGFCASTTGTSNYLGKGGGLYAGNPPPESLNYYVTVAGNSASQGGGIYHDHYDHWDWNWSLIGKNAARTAQSPEPDCHGALHTLGLTYYPIFVQNATGCTVYPGNNGDVTGQDPLLNALADNGGKYTDYKPHTHALQAGSPAIDKAVNSTNINEDQRGVARPQGAYRDLGSVERQ